MPTAKVRSSRRVTMGGPVSLHDCAITQRSIALLDLPVTFSLDAAAAGASFPYRWEEGYRSRVGLLPRDGDSTDVVWHDVEPCYVFHPMNAFDDPDGDGVVLDVVRHPSMFRTQPSRPVRRVADVGALASRRPRGRGQGGAARRPGPGVPAGRRAPRRPAPPLRLRRGRRRGGRHRRHRVGAAPPRLRAGNERGPFLRPGGQPGRGGLRAPRRTAPASPTAGSSCSCTRPRRDTSALHILNADDLTGEAQAVVELPQRVPAGFHGNWVPDQA